MTVRKRRSAVSGPAAWTGSGPDPYLVGHRDGFQEGQCALPYRPPAGRPADRDRWFRLYLQGYAAGYAVASGIEIEDLQPEDRQVRTNVFH